MPLAAEGTPIGGALALDAGDQRGIEGVALGAVAAFPRAALAALVGRGLFHGSNHSLKAAPGAGESLAPGGEMGQDPAARVAPARKVTAGLGPAFVDGAKLREGIQRHAGAIAALFQAAHPVVLDHQFLRHAIARLQRDHQVAAAAAAGAGGNDIGIGSGNEDFTCAGLAARGDVCFQQMACAVAPRCFVVSLAGFNPR
ncbi:MAG: hypothetical protein JWQ62_539 [Lacunisphaera sp.]|nr:hypothetical protein [Lacunisphaera sp.]